jgi:2-methylcitrate dehydratase PrpD
LPVSATTAAPAFTGDPHSAAADGPAPLEDEDFAAVLGRFACPLSLDDLPATAIAAAKTNIFDTLACAAAGSGARGVADARELALEWGGAPQATILAFGDKIPAHHAAWVNATMAHARDYDDTHDAAVLHAGVSVIPAALAAAERLGGVSGNDFIAAVAAGLETICRLGVATRIGIIESGFMYTSLFGHFAATVAAGRVAGLDSTQMVNALGIAYSQVAGNHQVTRDGALTKRMQPGFAAQAALVSVQLAQRGVRGAQATFEGVDGFLRVYLRDRCDREALREGLGQRYEFTQLSYKPYPCCRFDHTAVDAAISLRASAGIGDGIGARSVRRVRVGVNRQAYEAVCTPVDVRKAPPSIVHAQFSIPFTVAAALIDGRVELRHFTDASIRREDILALAQRVDAYVDDDIEREWGRNISPAEVRLEMNDGSTHRLRVDWPLGHPRRPMSVADFDAKAADCFRASALPLHEDAPIQLRNLVGSLESVDDIRTLVRVLQPASS